MRLGRRLGWEGFRWFSPGILLAVIVISVLCQVGDLYYGETLIWELKNGGLEYDALYYYLEGGIMFGIVSLCCVSFAGAGLYAQDYEENAVYMRIQRMGIRRYAGHRILQVSAVSWFLGCVGKLFVFPAVALIFRVPMLPQPENVSMYYDMSKLLGSGHVLLFVAALGVLAGFQALFYTLVTFVISFLVPHRRVLAAIPMLFWYLNQYVLPWIKWLPWYLQPSRVFYFPYPALGLEGVSEWGLLGGVAVGMALMVLAVWSLFVLHLRRDGIFGGDQDE